MKKLREELDAVRAHRWVDLHMERQDGAQTLFIMIFVNDDQGDDDENVESILESIESAVPKYVGTEIPSHHSNPWAASILYDVSPFDVRNVISSTANDVAGRRPKHGSLGARLMPGRERWNQRKGLA